MPALGLDLGETWDYLTSFAPQRIHHSHDSWPPAVPSRPKHRALEGVLVPGTGRQDNVLLSTCSISKQLVSAGHWNICCRRTFGQYSIPLGHCHVTMGEIGPHTGGPLHSCLACWLWLASIIILPVGARLTSHPAVTLMLKQCKVHKKLGAVSFEVHAASGV